MRELILEIHQLQIALDQAESLAIVFCLLAFIWLYSDRRLGRPRSDASQSSKRYPKYRNARVVNVLDGDTVIVSGWVFQETIRLDSIDCPENGQHWGNTSKAGLIKLIGGKSVRIEEHTKDKYNRTVATVYVWHVGKRDWVNVNTRMVVLGHAWVYRQFYDHLSEDRKAELNRMEWWAQSKKVGLWRNPNPVPPWKWRTERKVVRFSPR